MTCETVRLPDGTIAIACGRRRRSPRCACGRPGRYLCDWKTPGARRATCSRPICDACAEEVATDKHLCRAHQETYRAWLDRRRAHPPRQGALQV